MNLTIKNEDRFTTEIKARLYETYYDYLDAGADGLAHMIISQQNLRYFNPTKNTERLWLEAGGDIQVVVSYSRDDASTVNLLIHAVNIAYIEEIIEMTGDRWQRYIKTGFNRWYK